jgi:tRNA-dihydrouridine synthase
MEGLTDRVWRNAHARFFGTEAANSAGVRYYAPFITPPQEQIWIAKKMADLLPEHNPCAAPVPQLLSRDAAATIWMIDELRRRGIEEINLNFGCPSGTVTAKGKGAGMLRDPGALDEFLYQIFAHCAGPISVKTRLGVASAEEFGAILRVYNKYPISELIVHPRVQKQLYRGVPDRAAFEKALEDCQMPVCYNGDVCTPAQLAEWDAFAAQNPRLEAVMVGRGIVADPALLRKAHGGAPADKAELRAFMDALYEGYAEAFGSRAAALNRMKGVWYYTIRLFDGYEKLEKQLRKLHEPWEYESTVGQIFARLPLRTDAPENLQ